MSISLKQNTKSLLLLLSAPWPLFNRPSIQLGTLKAFVRQKLPDIEVSAHHFYLQLAEHLGYDVYKRISMRTWLAESVYAALLFPEKSDAAQALFIREARADPTLGTIDFQQLVKKTGELSDAFIASLPNREMVLAGVSASICQLTASLYFIKKLKARFPMLPIVVGGALVAGKPGNDLLRLFPEIDFVVQGEGELPLTTLLGYLQKGFKLNGIPPIEGVNASQWQGKREKRSFCQVDQLSALPVPDYDDYFKLLKGFPPEKRFFPALPVEASRGCWWHPHLSETGIGGCAFCNLNLQWQGYRSKSTDEVVAQIKFLVSRYQVLSLLFTDNVMPPHICPTLFSLLSELKMDFRLFAEVRAQTPLSILRQMKRAGMRELQIGIEALSSSLLKRMHKGTRAIDNIQVMKACEAVGIENASNLLIHFPGSTAQEVQETLVSLDFVKPFQPLRPVRFWLGLESPVWQQSKVFGLKAVSNHSNYRYLFPDSILKQLTLTIQGYRGDIGHQRRLWQPVVKKIDQWRKEYSTLVKDQRSGPPLHYQDGRNFLIIVQRRPQAAPLKHRLSGNSRAIYLFCMKHRSGKRILMRFSSLSESNIRNFLKMMVKKRLMFEENDRYLSLAVPLRD